MCSLVLYEQFGSWWTHEQNCRLSQTKKALYKLIQFVIYLNALPDVLQKLNS